MKMKKHFIVVSPAFWRSSFPLFLLGFKWKSAPRGSSKDLRFHIKIVCIWKWNQSAAFPFQALPKNQLLNLAYCKISRKCMVVPTVPTTTVLSSNKVTTPTPGSSFTSFSLLLFSPLSLLSAGSSLQFTAFAIAQLLAGSTMHCIVMGLHTRENV